MSERSGQETELSPLVTAASPGPVETAESGRGPVAVRQSLSPIGRGAEERTQQAGAANSSSLTGLTGVVGAEERGVEDSVVSAGQATQKAKATERTGLLEKSASPQQQQQQHHHHREQRTKNAEKTEQNQGAESSKEKEGARSVTLGVVFAAFVLTSLGNRLFQKLQTYPMYNYPLTVNMLSTMIYVPVCFAYVIPTIWCMDPSPITPAQRAIPKSRFAVMGALDCVSSLMQVLAVNFIPNASTLVLLQQSAIPISMVVSRLSFAHVRYDYWQIGGAAVVLCGIVTVLSPQFGSSSSRQQQQQNMGDDDASAAVEENGGALPEWCWQCMIILSCVPMCVGSVFKEKALGDHDIDVVYLNGWIAVFQTFMSIPLAFPTAAMTDLPFSQLPENFIDGVKCYAGINSIGVKTQGQRAASFFDDDDDWTDPRPADKCETAPYFVTAFLVFNLAYNVLIILILKLASSSLLYLTSTILVPISNGMFSLKFIPGHKPLHLADVLGLLVIMLGLTLYRAGSVVWNFLQKSEGPLAGLRSLLLFDDDDDDDDEDDFDDDFENRRRKTASLLATTRAVAPQKQQRGLLIDEEQPEPPSPLVRETLRAAAIARKNARLRRRQQAGRPVSGDDDRQQPRFFVGLARSRQRRAKVARFFGFNQIEMLQPMVVAQKSQIRHSRIRNSAQIRQSFLLKLGFSPDPASIDRSPARLQHPARGASPQLTRSPGDIRRMRVQHLLAQGGVNAHQDPNFTRLIDHGRSFSFDNRAAARRASSGSSLLAGPPRNQRPPRPL